MKTPLLRMFINRFAITSLVTVLGCMALPGSRVAAGPFDITPDGTSNQNNGPDTTSSISWDHTIGSGSDRILIVGISYRDANRTINTATFGGQDLSPIDSTTKGKIRVVMYYFLDPPVSTNTISVSFSGDVNVVGGAASFFNVHQTNPIGLYTPASDNSDNPSVMVSSADREVVIDTFASGDALSASVGGSQTEQWNDQTDTSGRHLVGGGSIADGAASVTMEWTLGTSKDWAMGAVPLKPALTPTAMTLISFSTRTAGTPTEPSSWVWIGLASLGVLWLALRVLHARRKRIE